MMPPRAAWSLVYAVVRIQEDGPVHVFSPRAFARGLGDIGRRVTSGNKVAGAMN
jgi:hypothetical protein